jgi:hypothetical protein
VIVSTTDTEDIMADDQSESALQVGSGTATLAAITGGAALLLAILGLNEILPFTMLEIATLLVGAGLMIEGSALTAQYSDARAVLTARERSLMGTGVSAELLGGAATIVLGILALIGVAPLVLAPSAAIVAGGAMLIGSASSERTRLISQVPSRLHGDERVQRDTQLERSTRAAVEASTGAEVLVGIGAIVLGVLALLGVEPLILSLVAMLALGAAIVLGGGAIGARLAALLSRHS